MIYFNSDYLEGAHPALLEKLNRDLQSRFRDGQEGRGAVR